MNYQQLYTEAQKRQAIADLLAGRVMQSRAPQQTGAIAPQMGIEHGLTQIGEALLARRAGKKADQAFAGAEEARRKAMVEALQGMSPQGSNQYAQAQSAIDAGVNPGVVQQYMQNQNQAPDLTDDMKEYQLAQSQGYPGSFQDYMLELKQAGGINVDARTMGNIPPGYELERDEQGNPVRLKAIPGSPAAIKAAQAAEAEAVKEEGIQAQKDLVSDEIERSFALLESPSLPETGAGAWLKAIPGTEAHALSQRLATIKANIGFDRLQQMREASPTGGALGQVSERELGFLQSVMGSLEQTQRKEDLEYNLMRLYNAYQDVVHGPGNGPQRMSELQLNTPESLPDFSKMSDEELRRLASGG